MSEISDILNALKFGQVHQLDIELTPEQSADLLTHIDDLHFAVNEQPELTARIAELEAENAALKAEPKPLAYWSDEKKQTYADNEGRSAKRSEE